MAAGGANIAATATANTTQFQSAMQQAAQAIDRLKQSVLQGGTSFPQLSANLSQLASSVSPAVASLRELEGQFQQVARSAAQMGTGLSTTLFSRIAQQAQQAAGGMGGLTLATSGAVREFIVMGHEIGMGNWTRLAGSLPVLAERLGGLSSIFGMISGQAVVIGSGLIAAGAAIAYVAYQAHEASASVSDTTSHLQLLGQGLDYSRNTVNQWQTDFRQRFNESASAVRTLTEYTDKLGPSATQQIPQVMNLVEAFAGIRREGLGDAVKDFKEQFGSTVESFNKGAESIGAINPLIEEHVQELIKAKDEAGAFAIIIQQLQDRFGAEGDAVRKNTTDMQAYAMALSGMGEAVGAAGAIIPVPSGRTQASPLGMSQAQSETARAGMEAERAHTPEVAKRAELEKALSDLKQREAALTQQIAGQEGDVSVQVENQAKLQEELTRNLQAQSNILAQMPQIHGAGDEAAFHTQMAHFEELRKAAGDNQQEIAKIVQQQAQAEISYYSAGTTEAVKAQNEATDATRTAVEQQVQLYMDGMRRQMDAARHNQQEQVNLQKEMIQHLGAVQEPGGAMWKDTHVQEYQEQLTHLQQLEGSAADAGYQRFAAAEREKVTAAGTNFAQIQNIYAEWAARAREMYGSGSTEFQEVQREMVRAAQESSQKIIQSAMQAAEGSQRTDELYLNAFKARMEEMVKSHQMTEQQALGFDIQYTAQLNTELMAQLDAIKRNANATTEIKQEVYDKELELSARNTEQITQDQEKIVAAADKTGSEIAKSLGKAFDNAGSSMEKAITDMLTGQAQRTPIGTQIFRSLTGDAVHLAGSLASQGAAKLFAPMLGVSATNAEGKSQGFGDVLGSWITKLVGLGGDKSKENTLQKSQSDLSQAIAHSSGYTEKLTDAIKALTDKITQAHPRGGAGGSAPAPTGTGTGTGDISDPRGLIPYIRQTAQKYNIDPNVAVKVAASEGLANPVGDNGKSGGAFQLYTGGGLGNVFQQQTGLNPLDPANEKQTIDFALQQASQGGWGPFHGAARSGISQWQGIGTGAGGGQDLATQVGQLNTSLQSNSQAVQTNTQAAGASKTSTDNLDSAVKQQTQATQHASSTVSSGSGASTAAGGTGLLSGVTQVTGALSNIVPGLKEFQQGLSAITGAFNGVKQLTSGVETLSSGMKTLSSTTSLASTATQTASSATQLASTATQGVTDANQLSAAAMAIDTAAVQTNAAAQAAGGAGSAAGGVGGAVGLFGLFQAGGGIVPSAREGAVHHWRAPSTHIPTLRMPSAAGGMSVNDGMGGQIAVVHPQEMTLPADISQGMQNIIRGGGSGAGAGYTSPSREGGGGGSGGDHFHLHISALDQQTGAQWLMKNRDHVARAMSSAVRHNNPATRGR
jgi:hypothetical protein